MARAAIPTYTTGDLVTAAHGNTYWRDNEAAHWAKIALEDASSTTMSANKTLTDSDVKWQFLDPGGASRDVTLPAVGSSNHPFWIENAADAWGEILTVKNAGGTAIGIIPRGQCRTFISSESAWYSVEGKYRQLFITSFDPYTTSGCADSVKIEMATNLNNYRYLGFDAATDQFSYINFALPEDFLSSSVYAKFYWFHPAATAYGVVWGLEAVAIGDNETLDVAGYSTVTVLDTGGTTNRLYISDMTGAMTIVGSPIAGDLVHMRAWRYAGHASDTLDVDANLIGVLLYYKVG